MEKSNDKKITHNNVMGRRLKVLALSRNQTNRQMADLLHYANEKSISYLYSGKQRLTDDRIEIVCNKFNVRENWLRGIDDFQTEADIQDKDISEYRKIRDYLGTLGLRIEPAIFWKASPRTLFLYYSDMERFLSDKAKSIISEEYKTAANENDYKNYANYDELWQGDYFELKSNPLNEKMQNISVLSKKSGIENDNDFDKYYGVYETEDGEELEIQILYKVTYEDGTYLELPIDKLRYFFTHIDRMCKASIETVLLDGYSDVFSL